MARRLRRPVLGLTGFLIVLTSWELAVRAEFINPFLTSRPRLVWDALYEAVQSGQAANDIRQSLISLVIGFGMAVVVGITAGLVTGWYRKAEYSLDPLVWFWYTSPTIAFYPLFIVVFGLGRPTTIAITFSFSIVPVLVNTQVGLKNVDPRLVQAARSFSAGGVNLFRKVMMPASVPMIMAGLRLGVGRALLGTVVAELFGSNVGLGFRIAREGALLRTSDMLAAVVLVVLLGVVLSQSMNFLERRVDSWRSTAT